MVEHLLLARPVKGAKLNRNFMYVAETIKAQARCVKAWTPFIDTAFCVSAYRISDFQILDEYVPFFERTLRKIVISADLLLIVSVERARPDDAIFILNLLETRARKGLPTIVDKDRGKRWDNIYKRIAVIGE